MTTQTKTNIPLYRSENDEYVRDATWHEAAASLAAGPEGHILVDGVRMWASVSLTQEVAACEVEHTSDGWCLEDPDGGTWWPSEAGDALLAREMAYHEELCKLMCCHPDLGAWSA